MEISVGPPTLTIHADEHFLVCAPDATISPDQQQGYFSTDTRIASRYGLMLSRTAPTLLNSAVVAPFSSRHEFVNAEIAASGGTIESGRLHLRLDRTIHHGLHEDYDLVNYSTDAVELELELRIEGDYARSLRCERAQLVRRGSLDSRWDPDEGALTTIYRNGEFERGLRIEVRRHDSNPEYANGLLSFRILLQPKERWHSCLLWIPLGAGGASAERPIESCHALLGGDSKLAERRQEWRRRATKIRTCDLGVNAVIAQAIDDLGALRMHRHDEDAAAHTGEGIEELVPAAGIPWFVIPLRPRHPRRLAADVAPHAGLRRSARCRRSPLCRAIATTTATISSRGRSSTSSGTASSRTSGLVPQTPYYGTHDATSLYVWAAAEAWRWTGEPRLLERLRPNVERALEWIDRDGDSDSDGLQEYQTRAGDWGYYNQSWKDSGLAIVNADGTNAELPIATCELQGYVVAAKRAWADAVEQAFDDSAAASRLREQAERLAETIEERFWWQDEGTYYLGLDGRKRPIESVASNAGHLLWAGAVTSERASSVVNRLLEEDMWSGWGVRTLSSDHVAYNPVSYQLGSVWPHDNAIIVNGCARYGEAEAAGRIARALLDATERFRYGRPPEVFGGIKRDEGSFPVQYLGANVPQAWASGAMIHLVHALLGIEPDAANKRLRLRPQLPEWLSEVELTNLRVGEAWVDLRVSGDRVAIEDQRGELDVQLTEPRSGVAAQKRLRAR